MLHSLPLLVLVASKSLAAKQSLIRIKSADFDFRSGWVLTKRCRAGNEWRGLRACGAASNAPYPFAVRRDRELLLPSDRAAIDGPRLCKLNGGGFDSDQAGALPDAYFFNCENAGRSRAIYGSRCSNDLA
jgi:hypothetical protein